MKRVLGVVVVALALALGVWGGAQTWLSASPAMNIEAGLAIVAGCNLALCLWVWYRARRGSGDAMVMPVIVLLSAAMLIGILPRLFWPATEGIHIAGSIASMIVTTVAVVRLFRRRRSLHHGARPM